MSTLSLKNDSSFAADGDGWLGPFLNFYCPGFAQILFKESRRRGLVILSLGWGGVLLLLSYLWFLVFVEQVAWTSQKVFFLTTMIFFIVCLWTAGLIDGYRVFSRRFLKTGTVGKSVGLALFFTILLPSLGHFYLRRSKKGILYIGLFLSCAVLAGASSALVPNRLYAPVAFLESIIWTVLYLRAFTDILKSTSQEAEETAYPERFYRTGYFKKLFTIMGVFVFFAHIPYEDIITRYVVSIAKVASPSMEPTVRRGDLVFVEKISNLKLIQGDIVVFELPEREEKMAKRILGLPGDTLTFTGDGTILVNQVPFKWQALAGAWPEEFDGKQLTVPLGHVFVIGDNPQYSYDSFQFGPIPLESIVGRVLKVFYPFRN
jgi:signal peptidase I